MTDEVVLQCTFIAVVSALTALCLVSCFLVFLRRQMAQKEASLGPNPFFVPIVRLYAALFAQPVASAAASLCFLYWYLRSASVSVVFVLTVVDIFSPLGALLDTLIITACVTCTAAVVLPALLPSPASLRCRGALGLAATVTNSLVAVLVCFCVAVAFASVPVRETDRVYYPDTRLYAAFSYLNASLIPAVVVAVSLVAAGFQVYLARLMARHARTAAAVSTFQPPSPPGLSLQGPRRLVLVSSVAFPLFVAVACFTFASRGAAEDSMLTTLTFWLRNCGSLIIYVLFGLLFARRPPSGRLPRQADFANPMAVIPSV
jgi:hypothetical protein